MAMPRPIPKPAAKIAICFPTDGSGFMRRWTDLRKSSARSETSRPMRVTFFEATVPALRALLLLSARKSRIKLSKSEAIFILQGLQSVGCVLVCKG